MKGNKLPPPQPYVQRPSDKAVDEFSKMSGTERSAFAENPKAKKYIDVTLTREKQRKRSARKRWWRDNWLAFLAMLFALIAALPVIIQGISTILGFLM